MHEFSLCRALLDTVGRVAREHRSRAVTGIRLRVGALSGIEPALLEHSFALARIGSVAEQALLEIVSASPRIHCRRCETEADVPPNRLLCPDCGGADIRVIDGDAMILETLTLEVDEPGTARVPDPHTPPALAVAPANA